MSNPVALAKLWESNDKQFFARNPFRHCHIRKAFENECEAEFRTLGDHKCDRRRIILWRVPADNRYYNPMQPQILKIPYLLFADETVEDSEELLRRIVHDLMVDVYAEGGL